MLQIKENPALVKDNTPDFLHFRFGGLKELLIRYGAKSQELNDAIQLIQDFIQKVNNMASPSDFGYNLHIELVLRFTSPKMLINFMS